MTKRDLVLMNQIRQLDNRLNHERMKNNHLRNAVTNREKMFSGGLGQIDNNAVQPGNVGELADIIWPFVFTARDVDRSPVIVGPGETGTGVFSVTQESGFVMMAYEKIVFIEDDQNPGQFSFIDPRQPDSAAKTPGLFATFRDAQSTRIFHDSPISVNQIGYEGKPSVLETPQLILPNNLFEVEYTNNDADNTYAVFMSFTGYRIRIEDAQKVLSTIIG